MSEVQGLSPDVTMMRDHLDFLFGNQTAGRVEIAWTSTTPPHALSHGETFSVHELDKAATRAADLNAQPYCNVYVGAALRSDDTPPFGRCSDDDAEALTAAYSDLDDPGAADAAAEKAYNTGTWPTAVVYTGKTPHTRAQLYYRLFDPLTDRKAWRSILKACCRYTNGDPSVVNPGRVLRLGGSVAWAVKEGRVHEMTRFVKPKNGKAWNLPALADAIGYDRNIDGTDAEVGDNRLKEVPISVSEVSDDNAFGIPREVIDDGRESFMFRMVNAAFISFIGENGAVPTVDELVRDVWPVYSKKVDLSRPGRGLNELHAKCRSIIQRFERGEHTRFKTLDDVLAAFAAREHERPLDDEDEQPQEQADQSKAFGATPFVLPPEKDIPRREWLYGRHLIRGFTAATVAPGGVGKSQQAIADALAMATGRTLIRNEPSKRLRAWYWNGEDPIDEITRRIAATMKHYGIEQADIDGHFFADSGRDMEIKIAVQDKSGTHIAAPVVAAMIKTIQDNKIDVVIIDPFVSSHSVTENDNMAIDAVVKTWGKIANVTGCAVELIHHVRKTNGDEVTVEDGRGAVALLAAVRSARALNQMPQVTAEKFGVDNRRRFFSVTVGKANLYVPDDASIWHELVNVDLDNGSMGLPGDSVGVVTAWDQPDPLANVTGRDVDACRAALLRTPGMNRRDKQSPNWFGYVICETLGWDCENKADLHKAERVLSIWIDNGSFRVEDDVNNKGRKTKVVRIGVQP